jgi:hypothetical protein
MEPIERFTAHTGAGAEPGGGGTVFQQAIAESSASGVVMR